MIAARGFRWIVFFFFDLLQSILGISTDIAYCTYIGEEGNSIGGFCVRLAFLRTEVHYTKPI